MENDDDTITDFRFYRLVFSHDEKHKGWCVFEQVNSHLEYSDGPWDTELEAKAVMLQLNKDQGTDFVNA